MIEPKSPTGYLLISVFLIISKVYEKTILSHISTFIENKLLYHEYQSR